MTLYMTYDTYYLYYILFMLLKSVYTKYYIIHKSLSLWLQKTELS